MKTIVKSSNIHGMGIFAQSSFIVGDKIEECEVIEFSIIDKDLINKTNIFNYYFEFEDGSGGVALGNGSLYNHSYSPNAYYVKDFKNKKVIFFAYRNISPG